MYTDEELAEQDAPCFAHMSDADIQHWIDRLTAERAVPMYRLMVSTAEAENTSTQLFRCKREAKRRASVSYAIAAE